MSQANANILEIKSYKTKLAVAGVLFCCIFMLSVWPELTFI